MEENVTFCRNGTKILFRGEEMSFNSHNLAVSVEWVVRDYFNCDRFGFGGIADADFIDGRGCYTAFAVVFAKIYNEDNRDAIDSFLNEYYDLLGKRIEEDEPRFEKAIKEFKELLKA